MGASVGARDWPAPTRRRCSRMSPLSPASPQLAYLCASCSERGTVRRAPGGGALFSVLVLSNFLSPRVSLRLKQGRGEGELPLFQPRGEIRETILIVNSNRPLVRPTQTDGLTGAS
jgi:hypothetical protein